MISETRGTAAQIHFAAATRGASKETLEDGMHANGKGQIQIADAVWKGLTQR
jgi:lysophospholipase L1-like esterase